MIANYTIPLSHCCFTTVTADSSSKSENKQKTAEDSTGRSLSSAMLRDTVSLAIGNANTIIIGVGVN